MTNTSGSGHLSPEEIREKYRIEREKRLRADGTRQFKAITGEFADFDRDPFSDPNFTRPAVTEEVEVVIVGAGFGGMLAAYNLQKAGITNFRMIDLAGTSVARGTGIAIPTVRATWSRTCICRCSKRRATCPPRST